MRAYKWHALPHSQSIVLSSPARAHKRLIQPLSAMRGWERLWPTHRLHCWALLTMALSLQGCALLDATSSPTFPDQHFAANTTELADVPFHPASDHQCGPGALASLLGQSGVVVTPSDLAAEIYLPGREGTLGIELTAAVRRYGRLPERLPPRLDAITQALAQGHAVLVLQNLGLDWLPRWHFATVIGYDAERDEVLLHSGEEARQALPGFTFEHTWSRSGRFALIALRHDQPPLFATAADWLQTLADAHAGPDAWQIATARWPASATAWFGLGNAWLTQSPAAGNTHSQAEQAFRQALAADSSFLPAANNLAMLLARRGERPAALLVLDQALQHTDQARAEADAMRPALLRTRIEIVNQP